MTVADLERLYDYGAWANRRLFSAAAQLTPAQFVEPVAGTYGSVRNTLVHVLSAEWGWLDRCGGHPRGAKLNPEDYPTRESVEQQWAVVEGHARRFLASLSDQDVLREVRYSLPGSEPRSMSLGNLMQHSALHAIHHRGQVALLLRTLNVTPGNFDLLFYDIEKREAS